MSTFQTALINGYFITNFDANIPLDIINICLLYCFLFDEFDITSSVNSKVTGINNTISMMTATESLSIVFTRNVIKPKGKYHWKFKISSIDPEGTDMIIGFMQKSLFSEIYRLNLRSTKYWDPAKDTVDIYLDADQNIIASQECNANDRSKNEFIINNNNQCRLCIRVTKKSANIELIEYHHSNWYIHKLSHNDKDPLSNIGYARCIYDIDAKIKHYLIGLKQYPFIESWNDEYLFCLIYSTQYKQAYEHAIKWQKGIESIAKLTRYFCSKKKDEFGYKLCRLLNEEQLKSYDLYFHAAYCYSLNGRKEDALKYYELYYDQQCDNNEMKQNVIMCIGNMAQLYYFEFDDDKKALQLYLKLEQKEINRRNFNGQIGFCYYKMKEYQKALHFFELHLKSNPDDFWAINQISYIYDDINDYENGKKYLLKALDVAQNDSDKAAIYTNFGVNAYFAGDIQEAIKYTNKALALNVAMKETAIRRSNLGKYYYKTSEFDESFKYLSEAITINPDNPDINGNYGIILYHKNKVDESIDHLEKCLLSKHTVDDKELILDCLYIYGQIKLDKHQYTQSIEKGLEIINSDHFENYKAKDKIYYLLSKNYTKLSELEQALKYLLKAKDWNGNEQVYQQEIDKIKNTK